MAGINAFSIVHDQLKAFRPGLLLLPAVVVLLAFFFIPLLLMVAQSLTVDNHFSLANYWSIVTNPLYRNSLWNSLWLSAAITLGSLVLCTPIAFFLARSRSPARRLARAGLLFPLSFPGIVVGFMIILLFGNTGLIPTLARVITGQTWLNVAYQLSGLYLAYLYFEIPRTTAILEGGVGQLDPRLEEAARCLGASQWRSFREVVSPCLRPALLSAGSLSFATSMGAFGTAFTLARGFTVLPIAMYSQYTLFFNISLASAMAIVLALFTLLVLYLYRSLEPAQGQ
jgi:putative spermidine/putrescine transport system permease protein